MNRRNEKPPRHMFSSVQFSSVHHMQCTRPHLFADRRCKTAQFFTLLNSSCNVFPSTVTRHGDSIGDGHAAKHPQADLMEEQAEAPDDGTNRPRDRQPLPAASLTTCATQLKSRSELDRVV